MIMMIVCLFTFTFMPKKRQRDRYKVFERVGGLQNYYYYYSCACASVGVLVNENLYYSKYVSTYTYLWYLPILITGGSPEQQMANIVIHM